MFSAPLIPDQSGQTVSAEYTEYGEYRYFATFAVALGARARRDVACSVRRIWANGTLIYNAATGLTHPGVKFRFYSGTEDQQPDGTIEKALGVGNVPAFRDLMYIVLTEFPCSDFGGSIPAIEAEIVDASGSPVRVFSTIAQIIELSSPHNFASGVDWSRDFGYGLYMRDGALTVRKYRLSGRAEIDQYETEDFFTNAALTSMPQAAAVAEWANLALVHGDRYYATTNTTPVELAVVNTNTGDVLDQTAPITDPEAVIDALRVVEAIRVTTDAGDDTFFVCATNASVLKPQYLWVYYFAADVGLVRVLAEQVSNSGNGSARSQKTNFVCRGRVTAEGSDAFYCRQVATNGNIELMRMHVGPSGSHPTIRDGVHPAITQEVYWTPLTDWSRPGYDRPYVIGLFYDEADDTLIALIRSTDGNFGNDTLTCAVKLDYDTKAVLWESADFNALSQNQNWRVWPAQSKGQNISAGSILIWAVTGSNLLELDTATGVLTPRAVPTSSADPQQFPRQSQGGILWDSRTKAAYDLMTGRIWRFDVPTIGAGATLDLPTIVRTFALAAGYPAGKINVTGLHGEKVAGYVVDGDKSLEDVTSALGLLYDFNVYEQFDTFTAGTPYDAAGQLRVAYDLVESDLAQLSETASNVSYMDVDRVTDTSLPYIITLTYFDLQTDYEVNTQNVKRHRFPAPTQYATDTLNLQTPLVLDGAGVKGLLYNVMARAWGSKATRVLRLPPRFVECDPGDVLRLSYDGEQFAALIEKQTINGDHSVTVMLRELDTRPIVSPLDPANETQTPIRDPNEIVEPTAVRAALLDLPALYPSEALPPPDLLYYRAALGAYRLNEWTNARIDARDDAGQFETVHYTEKRAEVAYATGLLSTDNPFETDYASVMIVTAQGIDLAAFTSATYDELIADPYRNLFCVGRGSEWEVAQFMEAVQLSPTSVRLTGFFRGRFGTDFNAGARKRVETFVLLNDAVARVAYDRLIYREGKNYVYRVQTNEDAGWQATTAVTRLQANYRKPYAVNDVRASRNEHEHVVFTWKRRGRFTDDTWPDGPEVVALGEMSELYHVQVWNSSWDVLVREWDDITGQQCLYTRDEQYEDGQQGKLTLNVVVYQINPTHAGRGYPAGGAIYVE